MNLYLFPENANFKSGYGIACESDYKRIDPDEEDIVVWYSKSKDNIYLKKSDLILSRPSKYSLKRINNLLNLDVSTKVHINDLSFLNEYDLDKIENIFCGDVIFYSAIRKIFPNRKIFVRFHNCFSRIYDRKRILRYKFDYVFEYNLRTFYKLETEIFKDNNVTKIFISKEDQNYYSLMTGNEDSELWQFNLDTNLSSKNRKEIKYSNKLVFFGGVSSHKKQSVLWFINSVFPVIKSQISDIEFHLWGNGTKRFNSTKDSIFGHGFFNSDGFPLRDESLYINPDIIGGGIKIKLMSYFNNGIPFISTPFGYEGYSKEYIDDKYCMVSSLEDWGNDIVKILSKGCK